MNEQTGLSVTWVYPDKRITFPIVLTPEDVRTIREATESETRGLALQAQLRYTLKSG
jgi:hypothetical protein